MKIMKIMNTIKNFLETIGTYTLLKTEKPGKIGILIIELARSLFKKPFSVRNFMDQLVKIGFDSIPVVLVTAVSTGMVLALQTGFTLETKFQGASQYLGGVVGLSFIRELGPTLTALIVTGRIGSAIAAEIGTMKVTEQIDALITLSTNPIQYLVVPRFLSAILMFPSLTIIANILGILGGGISAVTAFNQSIHLYIEQTILYIGITDIIQGLIKSVVFGAIMAIVSCFEGFQTYGGAEGVGHATTRAVVISSLSIIVADYFMNALLIQYFA